MVDDIDFHRNLYKTRPFFPRLVIEVLLTGFIVDTHKNLSLILQRFSREKRDGPDW